MRRRIWLVIGALLFIALAFIAVAFRAQPKEDFAFLKPYVLTEKISYHRKDYEGSRPYRLQRLELRGKSTKQFASLLEAEFREKRGWDLQQGSGHHGEFMLIGKDAKGENVVFLFRMSNGETHASYQHNLSSGEYWMLRLQNIGRDPFAPEN